MTEKSGSNTGLAGIGDMEAQNRLAVIEGIIESAKLKYEVLEPSARSQNQTMVRIEGSRDASVSFYVEDLEMLSYGMHPTAFTVEGLRQGMKNFNEVLDVYARCRNIIKDLESFEGFDWFCFDTDPVVLEDQLPKSAIPDPTFAGLNWGHYWVRVSEGHLVIRDLLKAGYVITLPVGKDSNGKVTEDQMAKMKAGWSVVESK